MSKGIFAGDPIIIGRDELSAAAKKFINENYRNDDDDKNYYFFNDRKNLETLASTFEEETVRIISEIPTGFDFDSGEKMSPLSPKAIATFERLVSVYNEDNQDGKSFAIDVDELRSETYWIISNACEIVTNRSSYFPGLNAYMEKIPQSQ